MTAHVWKDIEREEIVRELEVVETSNSLLIQFDEIPQHKKCDI